MHARPVTLAEGISHDIASRADRAAALWLRQRNVTLALERPVVSFTFDDVPDSAVTNGARILAEHGCGGTYYLAGGLADASFGPWRFFSRSDVSLLLDQGHEVGCHTFSHPIVQTLDRARLTEELDRNRQWLTAADPRVKLESMAFPYGSVGFFQKAWTADRFTSCRGVRHGLNVGRVDRAQLRAVQLYDCRLDAEGLAEIIAETVRSKAWLVFYTHDVQDAPSEHGCSPALMERAVEAALAAGCAVLPVRDAMALAGESKLPQSRAA